MYVYKKINFISATCGRIEKAIVTRANFFIYPHKLRVDQSSETLIPRKSESLKRFQGHSV